MRKTDIMIAGVMALAVTGCSGGSDGTPVSKDLMAEPVELGEDAIIGRPLTMVRAGDALVIWDNKIDSAFHLIDLAEGRYIGEVGARGEGPGELSPISLPSAVTGNSAAVGVFDGSRNTYYIGELDLKQQPHLKLTQPVQLEDGWFIGRLANGNIINSNGYVDHLEAFSIYTPDGRLIGRYGDRMIPEDQKKSLGPVTLTAAYQCSVEVSPDGSKVAAVFGTPDSGAGFYEVDGDSVKLVSQFMDSRANHHFDVENNVYMGVDFSDNTPRGIVDSASDADYVYLLTSEEPLSSDDYTANTIKVYTWEGKHSATYHLDKRVRLITAPDAEGWMYAIQIDGGDPELVRFAVDR